MSRASDDASASLLVLDATKRGRLLMSIDWVKLGVVSGFSGATLP